MASALLSAQLYENPSVALTENAEQRWPLDLGQIDKDSNLPC